MSVDLLNQFGRSFLRASTFRARAADVYAGLPVAALLKPDRQQAEFIQEVLPIAGFLGAFETCARRIRCKHFAGASATCDAGLRLTGDEVDCRYHPTEYNLEVTCAMPKFEHIARYELLNKGSAFDPRGLEHLSDERSAWTSGTTAAELGREQLVAMDIEQINERLLSKSSKVYPENTLLLVVAPPGRSRSSEDWLRIVKSVDTARAAACFKMIYLISPDGSVVLRV